MSVILLPDKWRRQPTGSVILSPSCDLTADAGFIIVPGPGGGLVDIAPASRSASRFTGSAVSPTPIGMGATGGSQITRVSGKKLEFPLTLFWLVWADLNSTSVYYRSGLHVDDSRTITLDLQEYGARLNYTYNWADAGGVWVGSFGTADRAGAYLLVATISHAQRALYVFDGRGRLEGSGTNSVDSSANDSYLTSGWKHHGGGTSAIKSLLAGYVPRQWSEPEIREFAKNPYQIFRKQPSILYFDAPSGGGATTGTGAPAAQSATVAGTATRTVTGSGTPTAQAATAAGAAEREITSSGTPAAQSATVSGTGTVGAVVTGSGSPQAQSATVAGTAEREVTASGTPSAQSATVAGTAEREITSSGTPTAQSATVVGTGQVGNIITGSGTPTAQSATVSGTAEREITASGTVSASSATVVGAAERTITGTGTLSASSATVYGFDTAPVSAGNPTSGGGIGRVYSSKKLRKEVDEWLEKQQESERQKILARIQREDEELLVIMLALAA